MGSVIGSAPSGQNAAPDGSEKIPISGSKYLLLSTAGNYLHGVALGFLSALMAPTVGFANAQGDAVGEIEYGGTAPSSTDRTAAIQSAIDALAASSTVGATLFWDGAWGLSGVLLIPSNFTIFAPNKQCGAILRTNANSSMFRNKDCLTNDASSNRQNTWGKINPTPGGDQDYRIIDDAFFANKNIAIIGGMWNGNRPNQAGAVFGTNEGAHCNFQFYGVDGLRLEGFAALSAQVMNIHTGNVRNVVVRDLILDQSPSGDVGVGCWQCEGPAQYIDARNLQVHNNQDDNIAFNADDGDDAAGVALYGAGFACGTNWSCSGAITDVLVDGLRFFRGAADETQGGGLRLLSAVARLDRIVIRNVAGTTTYQGFIITNFNGGTLVAGSGNFGRISFEDISVAFSAPHGGHPDQMALFNIDAQIESISITRRKIISPPNVYDVYVGIAAGGGIGFLHIEDVVIWTPPGGTNHAQPYVNIAGNVGALKIKNFSGLRDSGYSVAATPIVKVATNGNIVVLDIDGWLDKATNMVEVADGTLSTCILRGLHSNAGGGSPLAIASGETVTNGMHNDLQFVGAFKSGAGTLTNDSASSFATGNHYAD